MGKQIEVSFDIITVMMPSVSLISFSLLFQLLMIVLQIHVRTEAHVLHFLQVAMGVIVLLDFQVFIAKTVSKLAICFICLQCFLHCLFPLICNYY